MAMLQSLIVSDGEQGKPEVTMGARFAGQERVPRDNRLAGIAQRLVACHLLMLLDDVIERSESVKVAVPTFGNRVSPRFDCAPVIAILEIERGEIAHRETVSTSAWGSDKRIKMLIERGVNAVVCGGVDRVSTQLLVDAGVAVCAGVSGESEQALRTFLKGDSPREAAEEIAE